MPIAAAPEIFMALEELAPMLEKALPQLEQMASGLGGDGLNGLNGSDGSGGDSSGDGGNSTGNGLNTSNTPNPALLLFGPLGDRKSTRLNSSHRL